jgi:hypothetical protein
MFYAGARGRALLYGRAGGVGGPRARWATGLEGEAGIFFKR